MLYITPITLVIRVNRFNHSVIVLIGLYFNLGRITHPQPLATIRRKPPYGDIVILFFLFYSDNSSIHF